MCCVDRLNPPPKADVSRPALKWGMHITAQYERQYAWRDWQTAYRALPNLRRKTVLDLGCAVGAQSQDLAALGAAVTGVDLNPELLAAAAAKNIPDATFVLGDVREVRLSEPVDGIWSSFTAAYFTDLQPVLQKWRSLLPPGGWLALTEVDDMFGHQPLPSRSSDILAAFAADSLASRRYDFSMGIKLASQMELAGFHVAQEICLADQELSFQGPASHDVVNAWADRFDRMRLLQASAGSEYGQLRSDFLTCLSSPAHRATARVCFCVAFKDGDTDARCPGLP
jgi:SAM-dependent methyltransferase